ERAVMRRSLLPGLLSVAKENLQNTDSIALFELGFVYLPKAGQQLPDEPQRLAVVLGGRRSVSTWDDQLGDKPKQYDFFDLKGVVESLLSDLHVPGVTFEPTKTVPHLHPGKAAEVKVGSNSAGVLGELHPKVAAAFGLTSSVLVAELDADAVIAAVPDRYPYRPFSTLPAAKRDVAVIVPDDLPADRVLGELRAAGGELLTEATLFDVYRGDSIPAGTKSLAFALTYQPKEKTLTDKEIDKAHEKIENRLKHVLKASIRGKQG
ncbi:MAG: phenylalanine--tRNA ligase subunit beta, partial [Gemmataceae bacterium]